MSSCVRVGKVKLNVGQHVRISKEEMKFAKRSERNYTDEIYRIVKLIRRTARTVYELEDLNDTNRMTVLREGAYTCSRH